MSLNWIASLESAAANEKTPLPAVAPSENLTASVDAFTVNAESRVALFKLTLAPVLPSALTNMETVLSRAMSLNTASALLALDEYSANKLTPLKPC